jgi:hypothetical protein
MNSLINNRIMRLCIKLGTKSLLGALLIILNQNIRPKMMKKRKKRKFKMTMEMRIKMRTIKRSQTSTNQSKLQSKLSKRSKYCSNLQRVTKIRTKMG